MSINRRLFLGALAAIIPGAALANEKPNLDRVERLTRVKEKVGEGVWIALYTQEGQEIFPPAPYRNASVNDDVVTWEVQWPVTKTMTLKGPLVMRGFAHEDGSRLLFTGNVSFADWYPRTLNPDEFFKVTGQWDISDV